MSRKARAAAFHCGKRHGCRSSTLHLQGNALAGSISIEGFLRQYDESFLYLPVCSRCPQVRKWRTKRSKPQRRGKMSPWSCEVLSIGPSALWPYWRPETLGVAPGWYRARLQRFCVEARANDSAKEDFFAPFSRSTPANTLAGDPARQNDRQEATWFTRNRVVRARPFFNRMPICFSIVSSDHQWITRRPASCSLAGVVLSLKLEHPNLT